MWGFGFTVFRVLGFQIFPNWRSSDINGRFLRLSGTCTGGCYLSGDTLESSSIYIMATEFCGRTCPPPSKKRTLGLLVQGLRIQVSVHCFGV